MSISSVATNIETVQSVPNGQLNQTSSATVSNEQHSMEIFIVFDFTYHFTP